MPLRLIQVTLPAGQDPDSLFEAATVFAAWEDTREEGRRVIQLTLPAGETEKVMDDLEERFAGVEGFRLILLPVEALLPRPDEKQEEEKEAEDDEGSPADDAEQDRISRQELYDDVTEGLGPSTVFLAMAGISAVVAAFGLLRDDLAMVIGAMVIAPLLRPNVALGLAATLGDAGLAWRALKANGAGVALAFAVALAVGRLFHVDPSVPALASRTLIDGASLALALAAGAAGTLAFTRGLSGAVIGVMVAVALVPPVVAAGVLLGAGELRSAMGALWLSAGNVVCINLAAIATFLLQGFRPRSWWEAERAKKATILAAAVWILVLAALVGILLLAPEG